MLHYLPQQRRHDVSSIRISVSLGRISLEVVGQISALIHWDRVEVINAESDGFLPDFGLLVAYLRNLLTELR